MRRKPTISVNLNCSCHQISHADRQSNSYHPNLGNAKIKERKKQNPRCLPLHGQHGYWIRKERLARRTYQSVPSTSNTMPLSDGASETLPFSGSRGANFFGGLRVWLIARVRRWSGLIFDFLKVWKGLPESTMVMRVYGDVLSMTDYVHHFWARDGFALGCTGTRPEASLSELLRAVFHLASRIPNPESQIPSPETVNGPAWAPK